MNGYQTKYLNYSSSTCVVSASGTQCVSESFDSVNLLIAIILLAMLLIQVYSAVMPFISKTMRQ